MVHSKKLIALSAGLMTLATAVSLGVALAQSNQDRSERDHGRDQDTENHHDQHDAVCDRNHGAEAAHCQARVIVGPNRAPKTNSIPSGFGPAQFRGAYSVSGTTGTNQTIAIVDAYHDPNILSDLNTYSTTFGIPTMNRCAVSGGTASAPCFQQVDQRGGTRYPKTNSGWALEMALDAEAAHALCQNCNILLVEADSNSFSNLLAAEDRAATMGAKVISNSWGGSEFSSQTSATYDGHFNKPGVAITVSSGDNGYGVEFPASSQYVTAVGGTTLTLNSSNARVTETTWSGSGSGCSAYEPKPSWQTDTLCAKRTVADVSADADPNTGAAVYDSVSYQGFRGWFKVGGTSLSSPLTAAMYALAGNVTSAIPANQMPYLNSASLFDVTSGSNGSCGGTYLCTAGVGYDGPTGMGSLNGIGGY